MPNRDELRIAYALPDREIPRVRMNFVSSLDGAVTLGGLSGALGGEGDRRLMQVLRSMCDVVLVAAGTVRAEGYGGLHLETVDASWRESHGLPAQPRLAMVSRSLDVGAEHPVVSEATTRPLGVTCSAAPAERRAALAAVADVRVCGDAAVDLAGALAQLAEVGLAQVLCEGGPHLFGELAEAELVDEVCLTLSPLLVGGEVPRIVQGAPERGRQMRLVHALSDEDGFVFLRYRSALG